MSTNGYPTHNDPQQVLAHCAASASCLPVTVLPIPGHAELVNDEHPNPRIFVAQTGRGHRWYQQGGRTAALKTVPQMIEIYERGLTFDHCKWEGEAGRCVLIEFEDSDVQAMTHGELQTLNLKTHHQLFDMKVSRLALALADEALGGLPNGLLYAEGLSLSLIAFLAAHYVEGCEIPAAKFGRLGATQQRRLVEVIEQELASDLSLARLADEVQLSPHHFLRVFKSTFGTTPHRYVQARRVEAAAEALRTFRSRPIAEIALEFGFASQAHMTNLMHRMLGATPRTLQRE